MRISSPLLSVLSLALFAMAGTAGAGAGLVEINQTCATTTGCLDGDSPGFPVTIGGATGKSYVLTSALSTTSLIQPMIRITSNRVSLDLGGFSVSNTVSSNTAPDVIEGTAFAGYAVIRNGSIRGGGRGADFSASAGTRIESVLFLNNGAGGIAVGDDSLIRDNRLTTSTATTGSGILTGDRSSVSGNLVENSSNDGIQVGDGCTVSGNTVTDSGSDGIDAGRGSNIFENTVRDNGSSGIRVDSSARISGNSSYSNEIDGIVAGFGSLISDNLVVSNQDDGIVAGDAGMVIGNNISLNQGTGLDLITSVYRNNNIQSPIPGVDVVGGIDGGGNICNGTTTCP